MGAQIIRYSEAFKLKVVEGTSVAAALGGRTQGFGEDSAETARSWNADGTRPFLRVNQISQLIDQA